MYLQHFGLKHDPLGKKAQLPMEQSSHLYSQLNFLLEAKGIGLVVGDAGTGKTTALRQWAQSLNPHQYEVVYQADNQFKPFDIYTQFAESLGLEREHRYSSLWHSLKQQLMDMYQGKKITPVWILDEAHRLPRDFLLNLPAFLNIEFDSRNIMVIILCGDTRLQALLQRSVFEPIASRIRFVMHWEAIDDLKIFSDIIKAAFEQAGKSETILSESGLQLIFMASRGRLRFADRIITASLQIASQENLNHLPDELIKRSIESYKMLGSKLVS